MVKPISSLSFAKVPIVDQKGNPSWNMLQWFSKIETKTNIALTDLGINPNAPIGNSNTTIGAIGGKTQNLTINGYLPATNIAGPIGPTQVGFTLDNVTDGTTRYAIINGGGLSGVALVDTSDLAIINFTSAHQNKILDNINDGVTYQRFTRVGSGQLSFPVALIASGVAATVGVAVPGVLNTDSIQWSFIGNPASGYASLSVISYVTPGNVNFQIGNPSAGSITPGAQMVNYMVIR
jgi:hypothetical protein